MKFYESINPKFDFPRMTVCTVCGNPTTNKCGKCSNAWYCRTECQKSDWKTHKKVCNYPFEIKESEGKGLGLFATRDLQVGDLVVREDPILHFKSGGAALLKSSQLFKEAYEKLERSKKNKITALAGPDPDAILCKLAMDFSLDSSSENEEW